MIHIGVGRPASLCDKGMRGNRVGVKHGCFGRTLILTRAVPRDCLTGLHSVNNTAMGIVPVVALVITVVHDLHGDTNSNHVTGTVTCGVTTAVAAVTGFRSGTTTVIAGRTGSEHHDLRGSFSGFLSRRLGAGFRFFCWRSHCFFRWLRCCCFLRYGRFSCICRGHFTLVNFCCKCRYRTKGETRNRQCKYQQKRHDFFHCVHWFSSFFGK